jgi:hypothetical protein
MPYDFMIHLEQGCAHRGTVQLVRLAQLGVQRLAGWLPVSPNGARR